MVLREWGVASQDGLQVSSGKLVGLITRGSESTDPGNSGPSGGAGSGAAVCRCGAGPHPEHDDRCAGGHVIAGNTLALIHGARSAAFWQEHAALVRGRYEAILADQGQSDPEEAPMAMRIAVAALARASVLEEGIAQRVCELGGPLTDDGRVRRAHQRWESVFDRVMAGLRIVGLARTPASVPTLAQYIATRSQETEEEHEDEAAGSAVEDEVGGPDSKHIGGAT